MIKTKQFNKLPDGFEMPKLGRDEVAVFVSLHNSKGPDQTPLYPTYGISNKATIITDDGPVEIAYVTQDAPDGKSPQLGDVIFESSQKGTIICKGSSPSDIRKFEYLMLHPANEANGGSTYRRETPGAKTKSELDKQKLVAAAVNFATDTPLDSLKSLLAERSIDTKGKTEDDVRLLALEEGKKKAFEVAVSLINAADAALLREMYEAGALKWNGQKKMVVSALTDTEFGAAGVRQTDSDKVGKLLDAASKNTELASLLLAEVELFREP